MRGTVIISEYLIYVPAAIIFNRRLNRLRGVSTWEGNIALVAILMQPATILIDHGHFQYNSVMLGFVIASMSSMLADRLLWGCIFFVGALCFKQMALYYAPAVFAYLVGMCLLPRVDYLRFLSISVVTLAGFITAFAPFLLGSLYESIRGLPMSQFKAPPILAALPLQLDPDSYHYRILLQLSQSVHRIFPFARGIFEDKVANVWCAFHTIHKLNVYPTGMLQRLSLCATLISILPGCMTISVFPRRELLPWAMASSAWGFFLCSFQVHEKSALLPLLPMTMLLGGEAGLGLETRAWIGWANTLGVWTLFPLLKRDGLRLPYFVVTILWSYLLGLPPTSFTPYTPGSAGLSAPTKLLHLAFYVAMGIWHCLEGFVATPAGKPDLWVVINVLIGFVGFGICWLWCTWQLILRSDILEDYFGVRIRLEEAAKEDGKPVSKKKTQ